jgi:Na+-translocating ferredoxin:NAD+ oxidoreductase RnfE subunit
MINQKIVYCSITFLNLVITPGAYIQFGTLVAFSTENMLEDDVDKRRHPDRVR